MDAATTATYQLARRATKRTARSAVANGKRIHAVRPGASVWARRFKDTLAALISDAGGEQAMSEARMQLCRRAAALCVEAEKLEVRIAGGPPSLEEVFKRSTDGLRPLDIITEAARVLHGIARLKGGDSLAEIAGKPREELDHIIDLLTRAATIANMAAAYGEVNLETYGQVCDRLNRCLRTLGLERIPRDLAPSLSEYLAQREDAASVDATVDEAIP
jgi:hypothetical protein